MKGGGDNREMGLRRGSCDARVPMSEARHEPPSGEDDVASSPAGPLDHASLVLPFSRLFVYRKRAQKGQRQQWPHDLSIDFVLD